MFSPIDSKLVGQNIAKLRRHREIEAATIATKIGLTESAYSKYERGETAITLDFLNKVSEEFDVNPAQLMNATPSNIIESIHDIANSAFSGNVIGDPTFNITNEAQEKLLESILEQNKKLTALMEKLAEKL
jgi:transcriptional regulator with XRE-family HTH domain